MILSGSRLAVVKGERDTTPPYRGAGGGRVTSLCCLYLPPRSVPASVRAVSKARIAMIGICRCGSRQRLAAPTSPVLLIARKGWLAIAVNKPSDSFRATARCRRWRALHEGLARGTVQVGRHGSVQGSDIVNDSLTTLDAPERAGAKTPLEHAQEQLNRVAFKLGLDTATIQLLRAPMQEHRVVAPVRMAQACRERGWV